MLMKKIIIHNFSLSSVTISWNYYKPTLIHSHVQVFRKVLDTANISPREPVLKLFPIFYFHIIYNLIRKKLVALNQFISDKLRNKVIAN